MKRYLVFIAILVSFITTLAFNEFNFFLIKKNNPENVPDNCKSSVFNTTVYSVDNEYYLSPVENFLEGKEWKRTPAVSNGDYFRRVPGYSIVYYIFVKPWGFQLGHTLLKYFQLLLFSLSVYCVYSLIKRIVKDDSMTFGLTLMYGITPMFSGWTYFTLTEGITPFLMIFYIFTLIKAYNSDNEKIKNLYYICSSFLIGYLILTRPYTAIAGLLLVALAIHDYYRNNHDFIIILKKIMVVGALPVIMILLWTYRNYRLTEELVPLERAYHPQSLDRMKPEFEGMLSFVKCWGEDGSQFNTYHQPMRHAALKGDTSIKYLHNILKEWPKKVINEFGYQRLFEILKDHQNVLFLQKEYFDNEVAMPHQYLPGQLEVQKKYHGLISEYKRNNFLSYWVSAPLIYLKRMVFHSNTSHLFLFQEEHRSIIIFNILRYLLVIFHVFIYLSLFINLFLMKNSYSKIVFVYMPLIFLLFFVFVHREIEQRYMLPILPVIFIGNVPLIISCLFNSVIKIKEKLKQLSIIRW